MCIETETFHHCCPRKKSIMPLAANQHVLSLITNYSDAFINQIFYNSYGNPTKRKKKFFYQKKEMRSRERVSLTFCILESYGLCLFTFLTFGHLIIIYVPLFGLISELQFCHLSFDWRVVIFLCLIYSCPLSFCFCQLAVHLANYLVLL